MTLENHIRFGDTTIEYEVRRSPRRKKTVQMTVVGGSLQVIAPLSTPEDELREIVRRRAPWVLGHTSRELLSAPPKRFVSGETLPYLGRNVHMMVEHADVGSTQVRFDHWRFRVELPRGLDDDERYVRVRGAVIRWYRARAAERLQAGVDRWWPRLGMGDKPRVLIRDQRQRWGSCAPDGTLRFNWRTMMLAPALIEYVVVHELAHLTVKNHSMDFWGLVSDVLPDVQSRRRRLREAGQTLPL